MLRHAFCAYVAANEAFMELAEWAVIGCAADHERGEARRFLRHPSVLNLALEAGEQAAEAVVRTAAERGLQGR